MKKLLLQNNKLLVVIGLVTLLPILAALQYHWIGQLSSGEVERMRAHLKTSAHHFDQAVNNELFPIQYTFRVSFTRSLSDVASELRLNHQYWSTRAAHPDLIESIFWVDYNADQQLELHEFDPATGTLDNMPWPDDLLGWRDYFLARNRLQLEQYNPSSADDLVVSRNNTNLNDMSGHLMSERPAIPIPVSIDTELSPEDLLANLNATSSGRAGHTLLVLNRKYLNETFFPQLQNEFFASDIDQIEMRIVSRTDEARVIYQSDSTLSVSHFEKPDIEKNIARLRWMSFASPSSIAFRYATLMDRSQPIADSLVNQAQRAWPSASQDSFILESQLVSDFPLQAIIHLARENDYPAGLTAEDLLVALTSLRQESLPLPTDTIVTPPNETPAPPTHAWALHVRHNMGSLEASVRANRWRNLILSFGILSILGIAVVMIYSSSRKSQLLAQRQVDFVTGVSHELRTPLAVIRSAADNLADGVVVEPGKMRKYGQLISREGKRLSDMVEQILELAGVQSGKKTLQFQSTSVTDMLDEALTTWEDTLNEKKFKVSKTIDQDLPELRTDPQAMKIVLSNLINNAIKYSNGHRWIGLTAQCVQNGRGPELQISVADQGIGIPAEELPHIFDEFYRGEDTKKTQIHGNGIGLSIVKKTMEAHGGRVTVDSQPNRGSTFTLHFPIFD